MNPLNTTITLTAINHILNTSCIAQLTATDGTIASQVIPIYGQDILHLSPPLLVKDRLKLSCIDTDYILSYEVINTHEYIGNFLVFVARMALQVTNASEILYRGYLIENGKNYDFTISMYQLLLENGGIELSLVQMPNNDGVLQLAPSNYVTGDKIPALLELTKKYFPEYPN